MRIKVSCRKLVWRIVSGLFSAVVASRYKEKKRETMECGNQVKNGKTDCHHVGICQMSNKFHEE